MPYLPILLFLTIATAQDLCHDPRTSDHNRSCSTPSFALQIPSVDGNPNHALHDTLWAVSHYFLNCARHPLTLYLTTIQNLGLCEDIDFEPQPDWGFCVAYILAKAVGAKIDTRERSVEHIGKGVCHTTETILRQKMDGYQETFRGWHWLVDYYDGMGYRPLEHADVAKAYRHIRSSVYRFYGFQKERERELDGERDGINVLIYDRSDIKKRNWTNAPDVVEVVRRIPDARVKYITSIPRGLGKQVMLFGKTDLVIAPHGAGMANTLFMKDGGAVVEIARESWEGWVKKYGNGWTGWHARLVGLELVYVGCQNDTKTCHKVHVQEVEKVVVRLIERIRENRVKQRIRIEGTRSTHNSRTNRVLFVPVVCVTGLLLVLLVRLLSGARFLSKRKAKIENFE